MDECSYRLLGEMTDGRSVGMNLPVSPSLFFLFTVIQTISQVMSRFSFILFPLSYFFYRTFVVSA